MPMPRFPNEPPPPALHVLVVEDDPVACEFMRKMLAGQNCARVISATVEDAINAFVRMAPDLVFLDIHLGDREYNGLDVLQVMRIYDERVKIVVISGDDSPGNIAQATREGAYGFIGKPLPASRVMHYIRECDRVL